MERVKAAAAAARTKAGAAVKQTSDVLAGLSLTEISAAVLAAVALVGVTTDGLPLVVRNQPVSFATGIAVCVFIVAASGVPKAKGLWKLAGFVLALVLAWVVYLAAWGATEATAARITVTFTGEGKGLRYAATATADLLPSDDLMTVFVTTGTRAQLSSCGRLQPELADRQPRRGVDVTGNDVTAAEGASGGATSSAAYDGTWMTVARVGPDSDGTATWTGGGSASGAAQALCIKVVVPARCAMGLTHGPGLCVIGSEAKETFWLADLDTAAATGT